MKNKSTLKFCTCLFVVFIYFLSIESAVSQEKNIFEISSKTEKQKKPNNKKNSKSRTEFYNLALNLGTAVYIENNLEKNVYGKGLISKVTMIDTKSFEFLKSYENKYKSAKIIIVEVNSINELKKSFDLTALTEMSHLKYVFIKCSFKCQKKDIENFVKVNPSVRVFYNAEKPS